VKGLEEVLGAHPFCSGLGKAELSLLVGCAKNVRFSEGDGIFKTGGSADRFFIVRSGEVAVELHEPGRGRLTVATVGAGDILGWSWLVPPHVWLFDGRAVTDCRAIALDGACLRKKCEENHDLGYELLKRVAVVVADRLAATRLQLLDVYGRRSEANP